MAGELSLQRLQRISELRIATEKKKSENHYQLASFIYEKAISALSDEVPFLGDVETLFSFFKRKDRLTIQKVENDLSQIDWSSNIPVAQQLIDMYADSNVNDSKRVIESRRKKNDFRFGSYGK